MSALETWETVTMSPNEARRPGLVHAAVAGKITTAEGAHALKMSPRQFRRLKARYRAEGVRGLVHRRRGQRRQPPFVAKITRPGTLGVVGRPRLFRLLDRGRRGRSSG